MEIRPSADAEYDYSGQRVMGAESTRRFSMLDRRSELEKAITDFNEDFHPMNKVGRILYWNADSGLEARS